MVWSTHLRPVIPQDLAATDNASENQEEKSVDQISSLNVIEKEDVLDSVFADPLFKRKLVPVVFSPASVVALERELAPLFKSPLLVSHPSFHSPPFVVIHEYFLKFREVSPFFIYVFFSLPI